MVTERVFVYRNLHYKHQVMYSVKSLKTNKVIMRTPLVYLTDVSFKVSEAGRQRVLRERRKNVHAGVTGYLAPIGIEAFNAPVLVSYNPYQSGKFTRVNDGSVIERAETAFINKSGVWVHE